VKGGTLRQAGVMERSCAVACGKDININTKLSLPFMRWLSVALLPFISLPAMTLTSSLDARIDPFSLLPTLKRTAGGNERGGGIFKNCLLEGWHCAKCLPILLSLALC
jgi:hypothetical protein